MTGDDRGRAAQGVPQCRAGLARAAAASRTRRTGSPCSATCSARTCVRRCRTPCASGGGSGRSSGARRSARRSSSSGARSSRPSWRTSRGSPSTWASASPTCGRSPGTACSRRTTTSPTGSWRTTSSRPGFSREAMEAYHPMMLDVAERLTGPLGPRAGTAGRAVDVPGDMTKLTLETIARTGFGHDFGSFERTRPHPFVDRHGRHPDATRSASTPSPSRWSRCCCAAPRGATRPTWRTSTARSTRWCGPAAARAAAATATCSTGCWRPPTRRPGERLSRREHPPPGHHLPGRRARDRPRAPSPSPCTTSPGTPTSPPAPAPRWTGCGATPRGPATSRSPSCATCAGSSTSRCGCGRRRPRSPARPARTPCWAGSIRCGGAPGRWC